MSISIRCRQEWHGTSKNPVHWNQWIWIIGLKKASGIMDPGIANPSKIQASAALSSWLLKARDRGVKTLARLTLQYPMQHTISVLCREASLFEVLSTSDMTTQCVSPATCHTCTEYAASRVEETVKWNPRCDVVLIWMKYCQIKV